MAIAYLSLGSNIDPEQNLCAAIRALRERFGDVRLSPVYRSAAVGFDGGDFLNAAARIETSMDPIHLDAWLHELEDAQGRDRSGPRFSSRTLDMDLLLYDKLILDGPGHLALPRPELEQQAFVLKPMVDIAAELEHPTRKMALRELLVQLPQDGGLRMVPLDCANPAP